MDNGYYISKGSQEVFFTLRNIDSVLERDIHICTLAQDLAVAEEKAFRITGIKCEYNPDSLGRRATWNKNTEMYISELAFDTATFQGGKYDGKRIIDIVVTDLSYVQWYYNNAYGAYSVAVKALLEKLPLFAVILEKERADMQDKVDAMKAKFDAIEFLGNVGDTVDVEFEFTKIEQCRVWFTTETGLNCSIDFKQNEVKEMYYRGFPYQLPLVNGKAKKLKGKTVVIKATIISNEEEINSNYCAKTSELEFVSFLSI
jgi:hypothetical protein